MKIQAFLSDLPHLGKEHIEICVLYLVLSLALNVFMVEVMNDANYSYHSLTTYNVLCPICP